MPTDAEGLPEEYYAKHPPLHLTRNAKASYVKALEDRVKKLEDQMADLASRLNGSMRRGYPWDDSSNSQSRVIHTIRMYQAQTGQDQP